MKKPIQHYRPAPTIGIAERRDGFWLWDETRGQNLSMRAATVEAAYVEALLYYQKRLAEVEAELKALTDKVDAFVAAVVPEEES